ncbi:MAG: hypothetical protein NVS2B4_18920 [Ramlibacter sp.]
MSVTNALSKRMEVVTHREGHVAALAFSGGVGWAAIGAGIPSEGEVARRVLAQDYGLVPRWTDDISHDTHENAWRTRELLAREGIQRIALVTHAWHMPRSVAEFEAVGFSVLPAPTGFAAVQTRPLLEWLPSADGLTLSRVVLREALGRLVAPAAGGHQRNGP